jgi:tRNA(Ile)-lysidine synthase
MRVICPRLLPLSVPAASELQGAPRSPAGDEVGLSEMTDEAGRGEMPARVGLFPSHVRETIRRYQMLEGGETVIVAASGGPDSTALVRALAALGPDLRLSIHLAHLDHALRPDAGEDAVFVSRMSEALCLPYHQGTAHPRALAAGEGISLEDAARRLRYRFLIGLARQTGASVVATGHTLDDQAETVLMRLLRGSGLEGLGGIPPVRVEAGVRIIRPLIETTRGEIEAYLKSHGIGWREDSTNRDPAILRNRIRGSLLPVLEGYNPNIRQALARLAALVRDDAEALQALSQAHAAAMLSGGTRAARISLAAFARLPIALQRRVLRTALQRVRGNLHAVRFVHLEEARRLALEGNTGSWLALPGGMRVTRLAGEVEVTAGTPASKSPSVYRLPVPGRIVAVEFGVQLAAEEFDAEDRDTGAEGISPGIEEPSGEARRTEVLLDGALLGEGLILRGPRPGDRFAPAGMGGQTKTLADYLSERKVPRHRRAFVPVLTTEGGEIVWIVSMRAAQVAQVTPATRRVVRVRAWPLRA